MSLLNVSVIFVVKLFALGISATSFSDLPVHVHVIALNVTQNQMRFISQLSLDLGGDGLSQENGVGVGDGGDVAVNVIRAVSVIGVFAGALIVASGDSGGPRGVDGASVRGADDDIGIARAILLQRSYYSHLYAMYGP